jgi:hypothetical protein
LWLNDLDASTGQILFGAVNTAKYHGSLQTIPILKSAGNYSNILIALSGISVNGVNLSSSNLPAAVVLDSGTTLMYLPNEITRPIYQQFNARIETRFGEITAYVPCAFAREDKTIDFTFSGVKIAVPYNEIVLPSTSRDGSGLKFNDGSPACAFGIGSSGGGGPLVLGDTFLRSAYVVYDLSNNQVSLAQTNFNATTDHFVEIEAGPDGVPDATMVASPVTDVKGVAVGGARRLKVVATSRGSVSL